MKILLCFTLFSVAGIFAQENAARNIPSSLLECYNTTTMLIKDNRLPHNIHTLIAIIRKIENTPGLNMDLRSLSVALLHRFRQDGIELNPNVQVQDGIIPFSPSGFSFFRSAATLRLVAGNAVSFPNSSLTDVERCTLHYMLSSSFEMAERGDESRVCSLVSQTAQYREKRDAVEEDDTDSQNIKDDAETLSPLELELIKHKTDDYHPKPSTEDPNWMYPAFPPNHPLNARLTVSFTSSSCPVENGVIRTDWGPVSAGSVLAGIAAALQPETVTLAELMSDDLQEKGYATGSALHNRWIATLAGDLAEVALRQGPSVGATSIGAIGGFNSTTLPRWYFLTTSENLEMTTAEIRGGLDGLILADSIASWYSSVSTLRLSQILDMYYSQRGVFNSSMRACNRRVLFTTVAENATMVDQAYSAALLLYEQVARVHISTDLIRSFVTSATNILTSYIPAMMNDDLNCQNTLPNEVNKTSTHLTIVLDTTWPFTIIQPYLATLLEGIDVGMYNSNFTIMSAYDGTLMINSSNSLLDFYSLNASQYGEFIPGFDLPKAISSLRILQTERLDQERTQNLGGTSADVVLILSYMSTISDTDREFCAEQLRIMRDEVPDAEVLFLTYGSRDRWSSLAVNATLDTFAITSSSTTDTITSLEPVIKRITFVPKRLINSACGSSFISSGSTASFIDYVEPGATNYYRLRPNYFSTDEAIVKVQGAGWGHLNVCSSRTVPRPNATSAADVTCASVTTNTHSISVACANADVINACEPLFLSVTANTSDTVSYQCTDGTVCRYPDMRKYTISYENLICRSSAVAFFLAPFILMASLLFNLLH